MSIDNAREIQLRRLRGYRAGLTMTQIKRELLQEFEFPPAVPDLLASACNLVDQAITLVETQEPMSRASSKANSIFRDVLHQYAGSAHMVTLEVVVNGTLFKCPARVTAATPDSVRVPYGGDEYVVAVIHG